MAGGFTKTGAWGWCRRFFRGEALKNLHGTTAIGHTRYSTTGSSHLRNAQPLTGNCRLGQIAIAHNGNLTKRRQGAR